MATQNRSRNAPRPGRTLVVFLAVTVGLFGILLGLDLTADKGDKSVWKPNLGLDLQGGTRITLQAQTPDGGAPDADKLDQARTIIDQRVNARGVAEAEVSTQGSDQVIIEVPGKSEQSIAEQVGRTAQLRFRLLWASTQSATAALPAEDRAAQDKIVAAADWSKLSVEQLLAAETQGLQSLPEEYQAGAAALQTLASGFVCAKKGLEVTDVADQPLVSCDPDTGEVMVLSPTVIEGTEIKSANPAVPQNQFDWVVELALKKAGTKTFDTITEALFAQQQAGSDQTSRFAIVLDGEVLSAPTTNSHFVDGRSQISGGFTAVTAKDLANQLRYGALPLTFELNSSSFEGPTLAGNQLNAGLWGGAIGLALTVVYLFLYYRGLGVVAIASVGVSILVTYGFVLLLGSSMGYTLTLPGLAGFIIAVGISIDSFIIYFERIRDDMRDGKSIRLAVETGWTVTNRTKLAANGVTILAALLIYIFAIGVVKGFAFALGLSTLIDLVVIFFFTKPLMSLVVRTKFYGQGHKMSGLDSTHLGVKGRDVTVIGSRSTASVGEENA